MPAIIVNDQEVVYNNCLLYVNGNEAGDLNDFIRSIRCSTGAQAKTPQALNPNGLPLKPNPINKEPTATITFYSASFKDAFYSMLNNRFTYFSIIFTEYVTGQVDGNQHVFSITNALVDEVNNAIDAQSEGSTYQLNVRAQDIQF